jgi:hypothetical protein
MNLLQEVITGDQTTYEILYQLPPINAITQCKVVSQFNRTIEAHSNPAEIIPLGIQGKTLSLSGSYGSPIDYLVGDAGSLDDILADYAIDVGLCVEVTSDPDGMAFLMEPGTWKIESYDIDREGIKQGKLDFNGTYTYIWNSGESMFKVFGEGEAI